MRNRPFLEKLITVMEGKCTGSLSGCKRTLLSLATFPHIFIFDLACNMSG